MSGWNSNFSEFWDAKFEFLVTLRPSIMKFPHCGLFDIISWNEHSVWFDGFFSQCRDLRDFSDTQILREINLGHFQSLENCHFEYYRVCDLLILAKTDISKCKIFEKSKSKASKNIKIAVFETLNSINELISRNIWVA